MSLRVTEDVVNAACDAAVGLIDEGVAGKIEFYTGTRPANVTDAPGETLLAEVDFQDPAFGDAANGEATANGLPLETTGLDDGDIGWARIVDGNDNPLWDDDDVGTDSENNITLNTLTVSSGVNFEVTEYDFSVNDET